MESPIRLHWLDPRNPHQPFPPVHLAMRDPNGLLAIGGDLSSTRLLRAYRQGIFPWYNPDEPILWWCPNPRTVLYPDELRVSRSLTKSLRRGNYALTVDRAFGEVLGACASSRSRSNGTWLGDDMRDAYMRLFASGYAHSVEVWRDRQLIGGLYGVALGRVFFGESMFSQQTDASKIALYWLCRQLAAWQFEMVDCQVSSAHLLSLGAREIPREQFLQRLAGAVELPPAVIRWQFGPDTPAAALHLPSP